MAVVKCRITRVLYRPARQKRADTGASAGRDKENTHVTLSVLRSDRTVADKRNAKRSVLKQGRGCALRPSAGAERIRPRGPSSNFVLFTRMYLSRVKTRSYARYPAEYLQIQLLKGVNVGAKRREASSSTIASGKR